MAAAEEVSQLSIPVTYLCLSVFMALMIPTVLEMSSSCSGAPLSHVSHTSTSFLLLSVKSKVKFCKMLKVLLRVLLALVRLSATVRGDM